MVKNHVRRRNPERVAWTVLLGSFFACVALLLGIGFGSWRWLRLAAANQTISMTYNGTVLINRSVPVGGPVDIPVGAVIATDEDAQATLKFTSPDGTEELASVQVFGRTEVSLTLADSPRYFTGVNPHRIQMALTSGRVRFSVSVTQSGRPVQVLVRSAPEAVTIIENPGSNVSLESTVAQTIVTVREGQALVSGQGTGIVLTTDERAEVRPGVAPIGPLPAERNLIRNFDFSAPLNPDADWAASVASPADPNEELGNVNLTTKEGRPAIWFLRSGQNWGQVSVTQEINQDVRGFKSLRLRLDMFVSLQDLWNCGVQGTECPVMVRIKYLDTGGGERGWLQGFYIKLNGNRAFGLTDCPSCSELGAQHLFVPPSQWFSFETEENLLEVFEAAGYPAATIKSIAIYASGHTFESYVTNVQLLASE